MTAHTQSMGAETHQLKRNRARVFIIAAGLFLLGSQGPDIGDLFGDHGHGDRASHRERISAEVDRVDQAAERAAQLAERAAMLAERAAEAAERASEAR